MGRRGPLPRVRNEDGYNPGHLAKEKLNTGQAGHLSCVISNDHPEPIAKGSGSGGARGSGDGGGTTGDWEYWKPHPLLVSKTAKLVWSELAPHLVKTGVVDQLSQMLFVEYCQCVGDALDYQKKLNPHPYNKTGQTTYVQKPEIKLVERCWERSREIAVLLGMDPKSRAQIEAARARSVPPSNKPASKKPPLTPGNGDSRAAGATQYSELDQVFD